MPGLSHALILNADYQPLKVVRWEQAVLLILDNRADLVADYAGELVRSASLSMPWPAVVRLQKYVKVRGRLRFNRQNVLARDGYQCAYCGVRPRLANGRPDIDELTLDHVIPRAQSRNGVVKTAEGRTLGVTCWENVLSSCRRCNSTKGDRTPEQAGMSYARAPRVPTNIDVLRMSLARLAAPEEWAPYLPDWGER